MPSFDSGSGRDPIDPDFAGLFRPDDGPAVPQDDEQPHFEPIVDPVVDPRDEPGAAGAELVVEMPVVRADPIADTGRLFRSQGVTGHEETVLALASDHNGRLRTLQRRDVEVVQPDAGPLPRQEALEVAVTGVAVAADASGDAVVPTNRRLSRGSRSSAAPGHRVRGITGGAVYLIVIGVTVLVAFANVLVADGKVGWPTGLALVVSSVYAALTVRREDDTVAIIVPPVAFLIAAITAGQLSIGSAEGSLLNRAVVAFFTLADNWYWIIGATMASLVIVLVRRRRG